MKIGCGASEEWLKGRVVRDAMLQVALYITGDICQLNQLTDFHDVASVRLGDRGANHEAEGEAGGLTDNVAVPG